MRKILFTFILVAVCTLVSSCKVGSYSQEVGLPDQAYLLLVSNGNYSEGVQVTIDNATTFNAKVLKERKGTIKGNTYAISKGRRVIKVSYRGKVIFDREIFISTQETKKIQLP